MLKAKNELRIREIDESRPEYSYYVNLCAVETVSHLFWECESVQDMIQRCYRWIKGGDWYRGTETIGKNAFFLGNLGLEGDKIVKCDLLWKHFVKYYIYRCRSLKKVPRFGNLRYELTGMVKGSNLPWIRYLDLMNDIS